ncbi:MAG: hypothetical protein B6D59_04665 [Campylobacteraceae bacterium 4484_4]|nr:MAG: hypothetical protein B6D59_04665 [Campylobacteraceae bacterium 4484_4]
MKKRETLLFGVIFGLTTAYAGWQDQIGGLMQKAKTLQSGTSSQSDSSHSTTASLPRSDMNAALKEALTDGVRYAVQNLGKEGGYLNNPLVHIPLPKHLQSAANLLKKAGGEKYVNDLVVALNKAAEEAAPKTADIFIGTIKKMSIDDAKKILSGPDDAATAYFRTHTSKELHSVIAPIVEKSMADNDVAKYYRTFQSFYKSQAGALQNGQLTALAGKLGMDRYLPSADDEDLNSYVTSRAIDGLMTMIAQKEKQIRDNPLMRNTKLLKKVFGAF